MDKLAGNLKNFVKELKFYTLDTVVTDRGWNDAISLAVLLTGFPSLILSAGVSYHGGSPFLSLLPALVPANLLSIASHYREKLRNQPSYTVRLSKFLTRDEEALFGEAETRMMSNLIVQTDEKHKAEFVQNVVTIAKHAPAVLAAYLDISGGNFSPKQDKRKQTRYHEMEMERLKFAQKSADMAERSPEMFHDYIFMLKDHKLIVDTNILPLVESLDAIVDSPMGPYAIGALRAACEKSPMIRQFIPHGKPEELLAAITLAEVRGVDLQELFNSKIYNYGKLIDAIETYANQNQPYNPQFDLRGGQDVA